MTGAHRGFVVNWGVSWSVQLQSGNLHLPELGLWLDAHEPQNELVFISHAHADHIAEHREVILSTATSRLMEARLPGVRREHVMAYGETRRFQEGARAFDLTLLPAGHIFGSAMSLIQAAEGSLLYTGDFKLRAGLSAEPCQPGPADVLIMETTYGRRHYQFPPTAGVVEGIIRFCREALDNDETPVLLGYSLGKSQELLCGLGEAGLPLMLHGSVHNLTRIYEQFGQCFPKYERYEAGSARGKVLLCPPQVVNSAMLRNLGKRRTAILTGWAVDSNCRYRYQCDAAFPLSDHADFSELVEIVKRVQPKKVYTLHGFASEFAHTLRELGFEAQPLSEQEQFVLPLRETVQSPGKVQSPKSRVQSPRTEAQGLQSKVQSLEVGDSFYEFARVSLLIGSDSRKLEKVRLLAEYLRRLSPGAIPLAATWFSGRPFPASQNKVLQLGWAVMRDAMCAVGGVEESALHQIYLKYSDLGETVGELLAREVTPSLSMQDIAELFRKLQEARGPLAKTPLLRGVLERATALEAKYLVKIITGDLRIGLKEGLVEEAVASAFGRPPEAVRQANLLLGDIGETARFAAENRLGEAAMVPFRPVKFMLASPEETAADVWERMHSNTGRGAAAGVEEAAQGDDSAGKVSDVASPVWVEDKYDGIRCQLHKVGSRVALYSRDLKDITSTFPELSDAARAVTADFIVDGEIMAMRADEVLPFANLQRRLGRRQVDLFMGEEVPIKFVAFDLLWCAGESLLNRTLRERRAALESLSLSGSFRLARITQVNSAAEIDSVFEAARGRNNEGLMIKDPWSVYAPGRRGLAWVKLKKALATLDCVVVGAEYGHGKRSKVLSDYTFAVRDETSGELKTIGKAYSGLTDVEIGQLTEHFFQTALRQRGRYFEVRPETVLEIAFDKIAPSDRHDSGLAMRFPRIVRIRTDKTVDEIDTLATARKLAAKWK